MEEALIILSGFGGLAAFALAIGQAVMWARRKPQGLPDDPTQRALAILQERYARGELDRDEYLERRGYLQLEAERLRELRP